MAESNAGGGILKKILSLVVVVVLGALGYGKYGGQNGADTPAPSETPAVSQEKTSNEGSSRGDNRGPSAKPKSRTEPKKKAQPKPSPRAEPKTPTADREADLRRELRASAGRIEKLFHDRKSKVWVEVQGVIVHKLRDDNVGSRHQLCLLDLINGHTLKISHNIDLAPYIPWEKGDVLSIRGRYEYNDKGGVVHWTHHDPKGRIEGGWIDHKGKRYE